MEKKITNFLTGKELNNETFEQLENYLGIGVDARTKMIKGKQTVTHETKKKVHVCLYIINTKKVELRNSKCLSSIKLNVNNNKTCDLALVNKNKACIVTDGLKIVSIEDLKPEIMKVKIDEEKDLKQEYEKRIVDLDELCKMYEINAKRHHYKETLISRSICYNYVKFLRGADHISEEEKDIINGSCRGPLQFVKKEQNLKDCIKYDINSMYTYIMMSDEFKFPVTVPIKKDIQEMQNATSFIVKLKIKNKHKYFAETEDNYYNNYHLEMLKLLNIEYEIAEQHYYEYEVIPSGLLFGYMKEIFDLKSKNNNKHAKPVGNCTWGTLSVKKDYVVSLENLEPWQIKDVVDFDIETGEAVLRDDSRPYKHKLGRIKSFLLAYGRLFMIKNILVPLEKKNFKVHHVNTDCVITNAQPEEMTKIYPLSNEMGMLKIEKQYGPNDKIKHIHAVVEEEYETNIFDAEEETE